MSGRRDSDALVISGYDSPRRSKAASTSPAHLRRSATRTEILRSHSTECARGKDHNNSDNFPPNDAQPSPFQRWLRHPLLYFLLIGLVLFAAHRTRQSHPESEQIRQHDPVALQIEAGDTSFQTEVAQTYLRMGAEHILTGSDHLLFLLALLLLVKGRLRVIAAVSAFTAAHSLTMAAAVLGLVHLPQEPVAAAVALSIIFVAAEIVLRQQGRANSASRWPWMMVFVFGWLHGFDFAGAASGAGLSQPSLLDALLFFNLGVELGQVLFIGCILITFAAARRIAHCIGVLQLLSVRRISPYAIAAIATLMFVQRLAAF